jgi:hypothetical protein
VTTYAGDCQKCSDRVELYRPTGTRVLRTVRHPQSAYAVGGFQCSGSFGPADRVAPKENR